MSSLLNQIANNALTKLELQDEAEIAFDNEDGSVHAFLDALKQNTSITSVTLEGDFLSCLRADSRDEVLKAFTGSQIQDVVIGDTLLLVQDLTKMVQNLKGLRSLELHDLVLQGRDAHFTAFEASLMQHPTLKEFHMSSNCETAIQKVCDLTKLSGVKKTNAGTRTKMATPPAQMNSAIAKSA